MSIHKEIHGMAGSVRALCQDPCMMALSLLQLLHIGEHLPQVLLYLKVFLISHFFCYTRVVIFRIFSMCFPPQIGSLLKESIIDLKVQKNNLDMVSVYLR